LTERAQERDAAPRTAYHRVSAFLARKGASVSKSSKKKTTNKPSAQPARTPVAPARREPTAEEIRQRAYDLYIRRGGAPGRAIDDWVAAERELRGS
jgi:Protein of unknown function (DUF2934)